MRRLVLATALVAFAAACTTSTTTSPSSSVAVASDRATPSPTERPTQRATPTATVSPTPAPTPVPAVAIGDIGDCTITQDEATAEVVATLEGTLLTLGDHAYPNGTQAEFEQCYGPAWGPFLDRTRPAIGNHDYVTEAGAPYWAYFGEAAGTPGEGWYSFDLGEWHIVALNSNCTIVACGRDSAQGQWLTQDLAATDARCVLAFSHHPAWSSVTRKHPGLADLWSLLREADAELMISGHEHLYERLAPMAADGTADPKGVRQFIVGTGGRMPHLFGVIHPTSEVRANFVFGVLRLELGPSDYAWEFVPAAGTEFTDSGSAECH